MERRAFGYDDFCKAVTGNTDIELRAQVSKSWIDPAYKLLQKTGFYEQEGIAPVDEIVNRFELFMNSEFNLPLLKIPVSEMYDAFERFRDWERDVHPRDDEAWVGSALYWEPIYKRIEDEWNNGNENGVKEGINQLIDYILHK